MRFSPYAMTDYGLHHRGGVVLPFNIDITKHSAAYAEAFWNLYWATTPEVDRFLDLPYEDFDGFRKLSDGYPFKSISQTQSLLSGDTSLVEELSTRTPAGFVEYLEAQRVGELVPTLPWDPELVGYLSPMPARLAMAQSLVDVRDAAALCQSVVAVDFRARRRM